MEEGIAYFFLPSASFTGRYGQRDEKNKERFRPLNTFGPLEIERAEGVCLCGALFCWIPFTHGKR